MRDALCRWSSRQSTKWRAVSERNRLLSTEVAVAATVGSIFDGLYDLGWNTTDILQALADYHESLDAEEFAAVMLILRTAAEEIRVVTA